MQYGAHLSGLISHFDAKGRGVFGLTLPGGVQRPVAVPFTTIGDVVLARFIKRERGLLIAALDSITTPGPERIPLPSPGLHQFPGAPWLHIDYPAQLRFKRDLINLAFKAAGHDERVTDVIPSSLTTFYRNRMDYAFGWKGELGLKEYGSWSRYRDVTEDILLSPEAPAILEVLRVLPQRFELKPWDNRSHEGDLRYVVIREGKNTGHRMVALIVKDLTRLTDELKSYLLSSLDSLATSIVLGENPLVTDLSWAERVVILKGRETLDEIVNGTRYSLHLNSFFQTNTAMAAVLQDNVWTMLGRDPEGQRLHRILDLYCGLGFFGLNFAQRDPELRVYGFELDAQAIELARRNAEQNGVAERCVFVSGPAEDLSWIDSPADLVIVDPPRAGLHPRVVNALLEKKPTSIVYVSCNHNRLVEELKRFKTSYRVVALQALDLFPHTPHVEVVVKMMTRERLSTMGRNEPKPAILAA